MFEGLFEAHDVSLRFPEMVLEGALEVGVFRGFGHFRQRLDELHFGVVRILHDIDEDVIQFLKFAHGLNPDCGVLTTNCTMGRASHVPFCERYKDFALGSSIWRFRGIAVRGMCQGV